MKKGFTVVEFLVVMVIIVVVVMVGVSLIKTDDPGNSIEDFKSTDAGITLPEPTDYIVDQSNVLTSDQKLELGKKLDAISEAGKIQIGVLILPSVKPLSIEQYSIRLAEKWKVGFKGKSNGAIILIATGDREVRIETGHGLTGQVTDSQAKRIIDNDMVPFLKKGDWYGGVNVAVDRLNSLAQ